MYTYNGSMSHLEKLLVSDTLLSYISRYTFYRDQIFAKIPIKCIRSIIDRIHKFRTELKIINRLERYDIERILYDFAETMHAFGIESNDLLKLRIMNDDMDSDYGITFTVFTNNISHVVTGINMKVWTKDKLAKLNLKLIVEVGDLNLNITWAYKNNNGIYVNYNRTEDILLARDEIKSILVEYSAKQVIYLMNIL